MCHQYLPVCTHYIPLTLISHAHRVSRATQAANSKQQVRPLGNGGTYRTNAQYRCRGTKSDKL